jgi:CARDB
MVRWRRITGLLAVLFVGLVPAAHAASYGKAVLTSCDKQLRTATFEGRMSALGRTKMQLRFTLQASTPDAPRWRRIDAPGFGTWITAPAGYGKYTYDKTVEDLLAPASYRAVVQFRWKNARGHVVRSQRSTSAACRQPDSRPDLAVRELRYGPKGYVAVIVNRGRSAADAFDVDFLRAGKPVGTGTVAGLAPGATTTVVVPGTPCVAGEQIQAIADPLAEVDEADEENNAILAPC